MLIWLIAGISPIWAETFSVSGTLTDNTGAAINEVEVLLMGPTGFSTTTNSSGIFNFATVPAGNYTLTASKSGYVWTPGSRVFSLSADRAGQNFVGSPATLFQATSYTFDRKWGGTQSNGDGQFQYPSFVALDASGNVYVVDLGNHRIQKFSVAGTFLAKWGTSGSGDGQFQYPYGVALDTVGNVYVADNDNCRIQKFSATGTFLAKWGTPGQFQVPYGVALDTSDNVYVAEWNNHRIQKFTVAGTFLARWGTSGSGDGQFQNPTGVALDAVGNIYVAEWTNHRIQKFSADGTFLAKWGTPGSGDGQFQNPTGVALDAAGNVYVSDTNNNRIQKFTSSGTFLAKWGTSGSGGGHFQSPIGVALDATGNVYVVEMNNHRIQKFIPGVAAPVPDTLTVSAVSVAPVNMMQGTEHAILRLTLSTNANSAVVSAMRFSLWQGFLPYWILEGLTSVKLFRDDNPANGLWDFMDSSLAMDGPFHAAKGVGTLTNFFETIATTPKVYFIVGAISSRSVGVLRVTMNTADVTVGAPEVVAPFAAVSKDGTVQDAPDVHTLLAGINGPPAGLAGTTMALMALTLRFGDSFVWSALKVSLTGTIPMSAVAAVRLYYDSAPLGIFDEADPPLLMGTTTLFDDGVRLATLSPNIIGLALGPDYYVWSHYWIAVETKSNAPSGSTVGVTLLDSSYATFQGVDTVSAANFPMGSPLVTITQAAPTTFTLAAQLVMTSRSISPLTVKQVDKNVPVQQFDIKTNNASANFTRIRMSVKGDAADGAVSVIKVYKDGNGDGSFNVEQDIFVASVTYNSVAPSDFNGGSAVIQFPVSQTLTTSKSTFFIVVDLADAPAAEPEKTIQFSWTAHEAESGHLEFFEITSGQFVTNLFGTLQYLGAIGQGVQVQSYLMKILDKKIPPPPGVSITLGAIMDLRIIKVQSAGNVILAWTAPGDGGAIGRPLSYIVKFSPIRMTSQAQFDAALTVTHSLIVTPLLTPSSWGITETLVITDLPKGLVHFAVEAVDEYGYQGSLSNVPYVAFMDPVVRTTLASTKDPETKIMIPVATTMTSVQVEIKTKTELSETTTLKIQKSLDKALDRLVVTVIREFTAKDFEGTEIKAFDQLVTMEIPYPDVDDDGVVDGTAIKAEDLKILRYNDSTDEWHAVSDGGTNKVDKPRKVVITQVKHFSLYTIGKAVAAVLDNLAIYPNPVNFQTAIRNTVKFERMTAGASIKIFNLHGSLVKDLPTGTATNDGSSGHAEWDGKNDQGEQVASGLYFYVVTSASGEKKSGKLAVTK